MPPSHLILYHLLLLLPSIFPSIRVFSKESVLHIRWPKYWSFSFSISPSNEYSGLISFRIDWLDLLAVQETFKSLLCQEATIRTRHRTTDWLKIGKGLWQGFILSPCLFNLYAEYIMRNAKLDESQVGIKIARRNINNLRYADDIIVMVESKEELKSPLMRWMKKVEKAGLKLNIHKMKIMASSSITSWQINGKNGSSDRFYFLGLQNHCGHWLQPWN